MGFRILSMIVASLTIKLPVSTGQDFIDRNNVETMSNRIDEEDIAVHPFADWGATDDGRNEWGRWYPECRLPLSPIDIPEHPPWFGFSNVTLVNYRKPLKRIQVGNNAELVILSVEDELNQLYLYGGPLNSKSKFRFLNGTFSWGEISTPKIGSSHLIGGEGFLMELQLIHINSIYKKLSDANGQPNSLAVLVFFFYLSEPTEPNLHLDPLISALDRIKGAGLQTSIEDTPMSFMFQNMSTTSYYHYTGSLTYPPCYKADYIVFRNPLPISPLQFIKFGQLESRVAKQFIENNYNSILVQNNFACNNSVHMGCGLDIH